MHKFSMQPNQSASHASTSTYIRLYIHMPSDHGCGLTFVKQFNHHRKIEFQVK